jgi:hypothetical protein
MELGQGQGWWIQGPGCAAAAPALPSPPSRQHSRRPPTAPSSLRHTPHSRYEGGRQNSLLQRLTLLQTVNRTGALAQTSSLHPPQPQQTQQEALPSLALPLIHTRTEDTEQQQQPRRTPGPALTGTRKGKHKQQQQSRLPQPLTSAAQRPGVMHDDVNCIRVIGNRVGLRGLRDA